METATVITQRHHQSIELPDGFLLDASQVYLKRVGRSVLLIPVDSNPWELLSSSLDNFTSDFMESRSQPQEQRRDALFE